MMPEKCIQVNSSSDDHPELAAFLAEWVRSGFNSTLAYLALHANVSRESASVLGSRMLGKVRKSDLLGAYGLGITDYLSQLKEGLHATRTLSDGTTVPDHKVRQYYHQVLGKILGIINELTLVQDEERVSVFDQLRKIYTIQTVENVNSDTDKSLEQ